MSLRPIGIEEMEVMRLLFGKRKQENDQPAVQTAVNHQYAGTAFAGLGHTGSFACERRLYRDLREQIPIVDAAIGKIVRLIGGCRVRCEDEDVQKEINAFLRQVKVNGGCYGIDQFLAIMLGDLITYGTAVGEIVMDRSGKKIEALYNASLDDVELYTEDNPLEVKIGVMNGSQRLPVKYPELVLFSTILNEPGKLYGTSVLRGLPFVGDVLMKIFKAIGTNWDRIGNVRFAVSYKPGDSDRSYTKERARQIASEWSKAMSSSEPRDFVSVGDVDIRVIGAENQVPECSVPARLLMEQIVSKLSIPPFLLGLTWSTTERMSSQQADILTSELEFYRRSVEGNIRRICELYLRLQGRKIPFDIEWDNINLQDEVELAKARLIRAQANALENTSEKSS